MPPGKDKESGLSPEIARLSAILARDPNSKLFIPLAEEYIKAGMADEAVMTLEEGLKTNPFYMSARVMLGKAYLEKGDADNAREQFEMVVKSVPDNLLAHRKLAEIYRDQGRLADAARSLKMITLLDPKDEEARRLLAGLESGAAPGPSAVKEPPVETEVEPGEAEPAPIQTFDLTELEEAVHEAGTEFEPEAEIVPVPEPVPEPRTGPDVMEMPVPENMITLEGTRQARPAVTEPADLTEDMEEDIPEVIPEDIPEVIPEVIPLAAALDEEDIATVVEAEEVAAVLDDEGAALAVDEEDIIPAAEEPEETPGGYGLQKEALDDIFASYRDAPTEEDTEPEGDAGVYEIEEDISAFEMEGFKLEPVKAEPEKEEPAKKEPFETETLAELYVSQGFYDRAISIYKNLLSGSPDDKALRQKLDDLYLLASADSARAAEEARKEADESAEVYEPVDFEALGAADVYEAEPLEALMESADEAGQTGYDEGAVRRLEQFLENIRRKAGA